MIEVREPGHTTTLPSCRPAATVRGMEGYSATSYGDGFADVYDDWYRDVSDVEATVASLNELAHGGRVLELGVGTGRLAIPLARSGLVVHGIDTSSAMLEQLDRNDPDHLVDTHIGDMVDGLPPGPFDLVFVAYNTLFNLTEAPRQAECFVQVAARLAPGGRFVVEAFVPEDARQPEQRSEGTVSVRSLTADRVVLSISMHRPDSSIAEGQFVELTERGGVRLRPWMIRYSTVEQLDEMARNAGFSLEHRWNSFAERNFDEHSDRHVSVYQLVTV
jgi:SAM-dependent methyltransferase